MTEELKIIMEIFANITDGALIGGVTYLVYMFLTDLVPWFLLTFLINKVIGMFQINLGKGDKDD